VTEDSPSLAALTADPHPHLAALRRQGPIGWVEALGGWVVVSHPMAVAVMRDADTFTVDDPRFTTSRVVGPSMLSTDGADHARHRQPFVEPFTPRASRAYFADFVEAESRRIVQALAPQGEAELRTALAGPLATASMRLALGLEDIPVAELLRWYGEIVQAVADLTAGEPLPESGREAYRSLTAAVQATLDSGGVGTFLGEISSAAGALSTTEMLSNAAVLLFGGIETTEGMIANLFFHLLAHPATLAAVRDDPDLLDAAIEESLRMEPAAATVDRYATRDVSIGGVDIKRGDLVLVSLAAANRDPAVFQDPDRFDPGRDGLRRQLAFAQGPHVCVGLHLARLQTRCAASNVLALPDLALVAERSTPPAGLVFRKPGAVWVQWSRG
jgi:cytochrome P450